MKLHNPIVVKKLIKVIESIKTLEQVKSTRRYIDLYYKQYGIQNKAIIELYFRRYKKRIKR